MKAVTRADLERLLQSTNDPSVLIPAFWLAAATGQIDGREAFALAGSPDLAQAATPGTGAKLAEVVQDAAEETGEDAFGLAGMIESHASAIDDLGNSRLALPLYDAIR